jgi:hypothetical protein
MPGRTKANHDKPVKMASLTVSTQNLQKMKQNSMFTADIYLGVSSYFTLQKIIQATKCEYNNEARTDLCTLESSQMVTAFNPLVSLFVIHSSYIYYSVIAIIFSEWRNSR